MVAPKQYPYELCLLTSLGGSQNNVGDIVLGDAVWISVSQCRDEKSGGSKVYELDGNRYEFSVIIYAPKNCPVLKQGAKIKVMQGDVMRLEGTVKLFSNDSMNCRIWV